MKKYIFVLNAVSVMAKLLKDKRIEGVLYIDQNTGKLTFKAYNRQSREREKDRLVKKLPWGWVKESVERVKVFGSFPKDTQPGRKECAYRQRTGRYRILLKPRITRISRISECRRILVFIMPSESEIN